MTQKPFIAKVRKWLFRLLLIGFILLNIIAAFHAYQFTHFSASDSPKTRSGDLSVLEKVGVLFLGISNPKPQNTILPQDSFQVVYFTSGKETLESWYIPVDSAQGEVILFHGYSGKKSSMLERAQKIRAMGYSTLLVDFRASGGSTGQQTTIGYDESEDVHAAVHYLQSQGKKNIFLLGTSMGSAAVLKAVSEQETEAKGIVLECPFESLLQTSKNRFENLGVPAFPAAHLLVFWGGIENGFWGFSHKPAAYAADITTPSLLIYGEQDKRVKRTEIDTIFAQLKGQKELLLFPTAAHGNYLVKEEEKWIMAVDRFLKLHR